MSVSFRLRTRVSLPVCFLDLGIRGGGGDPESIIELCLFDHIAACPCTASEIMSLLSCVKTVSLALG